MKITNSNGGSSCEGIPFEGEIIGRSLQIKDEEGQFLLPTFLRGRFKNHTIVHGKGVKTNGRWEKFFWETLTQSPIPSQKSRKERYRRRPCVPSFR